MSEEIKQQQAQEHSESPAIVKVVVTHNGQFHIDEACAIAMLKLCYPDHHLEIVRTRSTDVIKEAQDDPDKIVVDVGQVYDHDKCCYDHHQASFTEGYDERNSQITALSSCGLIYRHYAEQLIKTIAQGPGLKLTEEQFATLDLPKICNYLYWSFVLPIDAHDNGVMYGDRSKLKFFPLELGVCISKFNGKTYKHDKQLARFEEAVAILQQIIRHSVESAIEFNYDYQNNLPAFQTAWENRVDKDILVLDSTLNNVAQYLKEFDPEQEVKFIICPKKGTEPLQWNLWTVNCKGERFKTLVPLISQDDAKALVGEEQVVFVHKSFFTGATFSKDSAITVAKKSLHDNWTLPNALKELEAAERYNQFAIAISVAGTAVVATILGYLYLN